MLGYLGLACRQGYLSLKLGLGLGALICLDILNRGAGLKAMVPTMPLFFSAGEISLPRLEKYHILDLLVIGNGGPLIIMCSNARVSRGFSIFGNTFTAVFWGFPQVRNPYKRLQGNGFFYATGWF